MGQGFHETAHNKIDPKKYAEGWERIFGKKEEEPEAAGNDCEHQWEYLRGNYKQCSQCEEKELK